MGHALISIPNDSELAGRLGKEGAANGITFYNRKVGDNVLVIVAPSDPAAKFNAVAETLTISNSVVISTRNVDKLFGESVIGCALLGKSAILTQDQDVSSIIQKSGLDATVLSEDDILARLGSSSSGNDGAPAVEIDHSFDVKGVGVVLLGIVKSGTIRVHDELVSSSGKKILIRSIQSQDQDIKEAGTNVRVGLAIRGAESGDISKGDLLSKSGVSRVGRLSASIRISDMVKDKRLDYNDMWLVCGFRSSICRVVQSGAAFDVELSAQLAIMAGEKFLLVRKDEPRIFASGIVL